MAEEYKKIPYGRQLISDEDIQAVVDVLKSERITQGLAIEHFERVLADYCGARYGVVVNSATSALHISCLAAGLGPGDRLWTSPNTFVASANCGLYCGAEVDFVDIDNDFYNMSLVALEEKLLKAAREGTLPDIVVPVHFAGEPCHMAKIWELSRKYNFRIIEDASHALGARYLSSPVGNCKYSDMTVFSFHPVKIITTGEGGIVLTNRKELYDKLLRLRSHGITRDPGQMEGSFQGPWYYQQIDLGFNYRMTDMQAALGTSQMKQLDEFVKCRHRLADRYDEKLKGLPLTLPPRHDDTYSAFHLYVVRLKTNEINASHKDVYESMQRYGIEVNVHYIPVHTQPYYRRFGFSEGDFPEAEKYYREAITLPLYPGLSEEDQDRVICSLKSALK